MAASLGRVSPPPPPMSSTTTTSSPPSSSSQLPSPSTARSQQTDASSVSTNTTSSGTRQVTLQWIDSSTNSVIPATSHSAARRIPIPRKGHTKSRQGCYSCKRRKVKCPETKPVCGPCYRNGLVCEYPPADGPSSGGGGSSSSGRTAARIEQAQLLAGRRLAARAPEEVSFTLEDFRFFHHFLLKAYPPMPLFGQAIWHDVAQMAHGFDYLAHAMLGIGASHLALCLGDGATTDRTPKTSTITASSRTAAAGLAHRVAALRSLNAALGRPSADTAESDARYATILALAFQSSYMADGMLDFVAMTRGFHVVPNASSNTPTVAPSPHEERAGRPDSLFACFSRETHSALVRRMNAARRGGEEAAADAESGQGEDGGAGGVGERHLPPQLQGQRQGPVDEFAEPFLAALRALGPLCRSPLDLTLMVRIESVANLGRVSATDGFDEVTDTYRWIGTLPHDDFTLLVDPSNFTAQLLIMHFFLLEYALFAGVLGSRGAGHNDIMSRTFPFRSAMNVVWLERLRERLPPEYRPYLQWAGGFARSLVIY